MSRQPRTHRRRGVRVELTARDRDVLLALARFRLARTSQLYRYAFAPVRRDTAAVRLRRLFDTRHITAIRLGPTEENLYRLGPVGRQLLEGEGLKVGAAPRSGIEHHLGVVECWTRLAADPDLELRRCLADWELRQELRVSELALVPDLFALVRLGEQLLPVAVEVDRGTEGAAVLRSKLERYAALWGRSPGLFGWERFGLLMILSAPHRRAVVGALVKKVWVLPVALILTHESPKSALHELMPQLQAPLSASPCRQGSQQGEAGVLADQAKP